MNRAAFNWIGACLFLLGSLQSVYAQSVEEQYVLPAGTDMSAFVQANLWVTTELDRTTCYVGEPVVVGYYLYTRLRSNSRISKRPALNGFSVYDMNTIADQEPVVVERKGQYFYQHLIRKVQVYAMQSGRFRIDPVEIDNTIQYAVEGMQLEGASVAQPYSYLANSEEQWINVKPLPHGDSSGTAAVGEFQLTARKKGIEPPVVGDPFTLEWVLEGSGNLALLSPPQIHWPADWTLVSSTATDEWSAREAPLSGKKIFRYTLLASKAQTIQVPAVRMPYFNPQRGTYADAISNPLELTIQTAAKAEMSSAAPTHVDDHSKSISWIWILPGLFLVIAGWWLLRKKKHRRREAPILTEINKRTEFDWDSLLFELDDRRFMQLFYGRLKSMEGTNPELKNWMQVCEQYLYGGKTEALNRQAMIDAAKRLDA